MIVAIFITTRNGQTIIPDVNQPVTGLFQTLPRVGESIILPNRTVRVINITHIPAINLAQDFPRTQIWIEYQS